MNFLISETFTDSLARLTADEQKQVKTTVFDLQVNPANPGHSLHKLDGARDKAFWSVRVGSDLRIIVHRQEGSFLLCFVDHHDKAYHWAERRRIERHPRTGAAQIVEIRETVQEIVVPRYVEETRAPKAKPAVFAHLTVEDLLDVGVPQEWTTDVLMANEDLLLDIATHLPQEAADAVLEMATGGSPRRQAAPVPSEDPFRHPDAQRRFRVIEDVSELERAFAFPWDKWTIFLHPAQRQMVEKDYNGPARVTGSAGTGKTIVALHRAVFLARRNEDARVLLTTLSESLADALRIRLRRLIHTEPRLGERIEVEAIDAIAQRLYERHVGKPQLANAQDVRQALEQATAEIGSVRFRAGFVLAEWNEVVDAWQIDSWEGYRDAPRLGRKTRLKAEERQMLWAIFERMARSLIEAGLVTMQGIYGELGRRLATAAHPPFEFAVVDEAQDIGPTQLRFLAAFAGKRPNGLFFAGDIGQRIFQQPFSWKSVGVEVRGRSRTLKINYRTSHQIRLQADRLLDPEIQDVDGNVDERKGTVSIFNGPQPVLRTFASAEQETAAVAEWLALRVKDGVAPSEIGVFVRSAAELPRAQAALAQAGIPHKTLDAKVQLVSGFATAGTMHLAKGLEFRAVAVIACDEDVIPSQERLNSATEESDHKEIYETERHLLYVACTRAREFLWVSAAGQASEFLTDLG